MQREKQMRRSHNDGVFVPTNALPIVALWVAGRGSWELLRIVTADF